MCADDCVVVYLSREGENMKMSQIYPPGFELSGANLDFERYPQIGQSPDYINSGSTTESYEHNGGSIGWLNDDDNVCSWSTADSGYGAHETLSEIW